MHVHLLMTLLLDSLSNREFQRKALKAAEMPFIETRLIDIDFIQYLMFPWSALNHI